MVIQKMLTQLYLSNLCRTLEMPSISRKRNLIFTLSSTWVITNSPGAGRSGITDTKLYVPVVTLSTQDNSKLLLIFEIWF